ncbi:proteasome assembly chaperone family protein [Acidianus sulfidivorans JP7]|uniref:Carboxylate--amine ligase n=1 Tax=Acidianus sulfidivorans JP7 TaxID=619593 RepID=A0A2U9IQQ9_9CREN|nr:proteasome assembly chaperone family protein [Acidianus sulfidivorans]AWR98316.1 proteasome assembly chaperone family protein [Acidianus sulfidivorans JP7]
MLVGVPDAGLVGEISTEFLIEKLNLKEFGELYSRKYIPPIMHITDGVAKSPLRVYHGNNLLVLHSWTALPASAAYPLADFVIKYAKKYDINTIISITGVPVQDRLDLDKPKAYWISSSVELSKELESINLTEKFGDGYIAGPYAPLLLESSRNGIRNIVIVVESFLDIPDPEASAIALDLISKYIGFKVDVSSLIKEAEDIRSKIKGLMEQTKKELPSYTSRPLTYA